MAELDRRINIQGNFNTGTVNGGMHFSADTEHLQEAPDKVHRQDRPSIFISHSHYDAGLAKLLVSLLAESLCIPSTVIRCSSLSGFSLPAGSHIDAELRPDLAAARVGIILVTPDSEGSTYIPSEAGALWVNSERVIHVMAGGAPPRGPLSGYRRIDGQVAAEVSSMLETIADSLGLQIEPPSRWMDRLSEFCESCRAPRSGTLQGKPDLT